MATYTSYLNLEKPTTSETFNLLKMNQNWDKIDAGVSALNSNLNSRIDQNVKVISIATNQTQSGIVIHYPEDVGFSILYIDANQRVAIICKGANYAPAYTMINGTFDNIGLDITATYLRVGNWVRGTLIITSSSIESITLGLYN